MNNTIPSGKLIKTISIRPLDIDLDIIRNSSNLYLEEFMIKSKEYFESQHIYLLPCLLFQSQLNTMGDNIFYTEEYTFGDVKTRFLILTKIDELNIEELQKIEQLSDEGRIITSFDLKFIDYAGKFTIKNKTDFFKLPDNGLILNTVYLKLKK